jgi:uncharacterized phiE125 gp8 family phage protein
MSCDICAPPRRLGALSIVVPPEDEPVSVPGLKTHLGIEGDGGDALIAGHIKAARRVVEAATGRALIEQCWDLALDEFAATIELPLAPVLWVSQIDYIATDGHRRTLPVSAYQVDLMSPVCRIRPAFERVWPETRRQMNAVIIRFVAGYSDLPSELPEDLAAAVMLVAATLYEYREPTQFPGGQATLPPLVRALLAPYRLLRPEAAASDGSGDCLARSQ